MGTGNSEAENTRIILNALAGDRRLRIWRANSGSAVTPDGRRVKFGVPGQADWTGIIVGTGQRLEIEIKSDTGRQTPVQRQFQAMIEAAGGVYVLARSPADVLGRLS